MIKNNNNAINRAIASLDGTTSTAKKFGITTQTVDQWLKGKRPVPMHRCIEFEYKTNLPGLCEKLRPDLMKYWEMMRSPNFKLKD